MLTLTLSPNVNKCFMKSLNVVYCSSQPIVVNVVNSVFPANVAPNGGFGSKILGRRPYGGAKVRQGVFVLFCDA